MLITFFLPHDHTDDSHEFLRVLIDQLSDDLCDKTQQQNSKPQKVTELQLDNMSFLVKANYFWRLHLSQNSSIITDNFCGQLVSTIECTVCKTKRFCFDPFYDLSLPFPKASVHHREYRRRFNHRLSISRIYDEEQTPCLIDDCFREFTKDELLSGENMAECGTCREKRESITRMQVIRFPRILVLHLKR